MALHRILTRVFLGIVFSIRICTALDFYFDAPANWKLADPKAYSPTVQVCFVDPKEGYSPSINLAVEKTSLSLDEYVNLSQKPYQRNPLAKWRNLGPYPSNAGEGRLIEIDLTSKAGKGRVLQFIVKIEGEVAVLTAAAGAQDLKNHLEAFKNSFRSLTATSNLLEKISDRKDLEELKNLLSSPELFQIGKPSQESMISPKAKQTIEQIEMILSKYSAQGPCWHFLALRHCAKLLEGTLIKAQ